MVLLWTSFSIESARFDTTFAMIGKYFQCLSGGIRKDQDCKPFRRDFEARTIPELVIVYFTLFSFLSYSNLPFIIQVKTVKHFVARTARRLSSKKSLSSMLSS